MNSALTFFSGLALAIWIFMGVTLYSQYHNDIPNRKKKWLFRAVCGPMIWCLVAISCIFDIFGYVDGILNSFIDWIRKP
jgi:hypothetical protein